MVTLHDNEIEAIDNAKSCMTKFELDRKSGLFIASVKEANLAMTIPPRLTSQQWGGRVSRRGMAGGVWRRLRGETVSVPGEVIEMVEVGRV